MSKVKNETRQKQMRQAAQLMKRILIHFRGQMDELLRPQGVTIAQLQVLYAIRSAPGSSGAQLARSCYVTPQTVQALLKHLEEGGFIVRGKDKANDRIVTASLTEAGERLMESAEKTALTIQERLWQGVADSDLGRLNELLMQCLGNIAPESVDEISGDR
jgi:DNA-binding MarR family transcriptional regulator